MNDEKANNDSERRFESEQTKFKQWPQRKQC